MSKKWISFLVAAVVGAVILAPSTAFATCQVQSISTLAPVDNVNTSNVIPGTYPGTGATPFMITPASNLSATGATLNAEGQAERAADILIFDDGLNAADVCFANTQVFTIAYNAPLPSSVSLSEFSTGNFFHFDVMDSAQPNGLRITTSASQVVAGFNTVVTNINIVVTNAGTGGDLVTGNAGAAVRIKNVRFDATQVSGATGTIDANVSWSGVSGSSVAGANTVRVGTKAATIGTVVAPTCGGTTAAGDCAFAKQSSSGTLTGNVTLATGGTSTLGNNNAAFSFDEGFAQAFRVAGTAAKPYSLVYNDIATNATDVIFNVTNLPSGVTVSFPGTISTSATDANGITFTTTNTSAISGSGAVVYNTIANGSSTSTVAVGTGAAAALNTVGVNIAAPSGYTTTPVFIDGYFGPGATSAFTGDPDVNASAIPRYATATARRFLHHNWFMVTPVRTILLFPLMQSLTGTGYQYISGLAVSNTGVDSVAANGLDIFGTATVAQTGAVTFYVFGRDTTAGTAVAFSVASTATGFAGRGLTNGLLAPGQTMATSIDAILAAGGQSSLAGHFEGYVIAVTSFDFGHGMGVIFNALSGGTSSYHAEVMTNNPRTTNESLNN